MFYCINNDTNNQILVNSLKIKRLEVATGKNDWAILFNFGEKKISFDFKPSNIINIYDIMNDISNLLPYTFDNPFITITDKDNIISAKSRLDSDEKIKQASYMLINCLDIILVSYNPTGKCYNIYFENNDTVRTLDSPSEIFYKINMKISNLDTISLNEKQLVYIQSSNEVFLQNEINKLNQKLIDKEKTDIHQKNIKGKL